MTISLDALGIAPGISGGAQAAVTPSSSDEHMSPYAAEIHAAVVTVERNRNPLLRTLLMYALRTATSPQEIAEARWDQIDLARAEWNIEACNGHGDRLVALPRQAVLCLQALRGWPGCQGDYALRLRKDQSVSSLVSAFRRAIRGTELGRPEGFRSIFQRGAVEHLGIRAEAVAAALGSPPEETAQLWRTHPAYQAERREVMQSWADHVDKVWYPIGKVRYALPDSR